MKKHTVIDNMASLDPVGAYETAERGRPRTPLERRVMLYLWHAEEAPLRRADLPPMTDTEAWRDRERRIASERDALCRGVIAAVDRHDVAELHALANEVEAWRDRNKKPMAKTMPGIIKRIVGGKPNTITARAALLALKSWLKEGHQTIKQSEVLKLLRKAGFVVLGKGEKKTNAWRKGYEAGRSIDLRTIQRFQREIRLPMAPPGRPKNGDK